MMSKRQQVVKPEIETRKILEKKVSQYETVSNYTIKNEFEILNKVNLSKNEDIPPQVGVR